MSQVVAVSGRTAAMALSLCCVTQSVRPRKFYFIRLLFIFSQTIGQSQPLSELSIHVTLLERKTLTVARSKQTFLLVSMELVHVLDPKVKGCLRVNDSGSLHVVDSDHPQNL